MGNWFDNLSGSKTGTGRETSYSEPLQGNVRTSEWTSVFDVDAKFRRWLISSDSTSEVADPVAEKSVLFALERVTEQSLSGTNLVPRMPSVLPELMSSLHDKNVSTLQLAHHIGRDSSLVAEVIREANSCYYHPTDKIVTVDKAVLVLGNTGLRAVVAKASIRPVINLQSGQLAKRSASRIWAQSERCAMACCILSGTYQANPFKAFLTGLIKNLGMTVAFRVIDMIYKGVVLPNSPEFCKSVEAHGLKISEWVARFWELPEEVICAIRELDPSNPCTPRHSSLGSALLMGDRISKLSLLVSHGLINKEESITGGFSEREFHCYQKLKAGV